MTYSDSTHQPENPADHGDPDGPVWMSPTGRHLTADLPVLAMALMLASCGGGDAQTDVPYKVGNPYVVNGVRYAPRDDRSYDRIGMASWYGKKFHGRKTASGQPYDMYAMTAAHPTLPTGTQVKVVNMETRRSVIVTINDRGPFAKGRIIDLSFAAAKKLGFTDQGTARVRVTYHKAARKN